MLSACARVLPNHPSENPKTELMPMTVGKTQLRVEVRDNEQERALGLSYREVMLKNEGMMFVFPVAAPYPFWMKGMEFDLDFVFIREGKVVGVTEQVSAPVNAGGSVKTVFPPQAVDRVLEVKAGWVKEHGIKVGDSVSM